MTKCKYESICTAYFFTKWACHPGSTHEQRMGGIPRTDVGCDMYHRFESKTCEVCSTKRNIEGWFCHECFKVVCITCKEKHKCPPKLLKKLKKTHSTKKPKNCKNCGRFLNDGNYCDTCALEHCPECGSAEYQGDNCQTCEEENEDEEEEL